MDGEPFVHDASGLGGLSWAGVEAGDVLFAVTVFRGTPYLLAAMEVAEIVGRERAAEALGVAAEDLYDAPEHALASSRLSTPMRFGRLIPERALEALRFVRPSEGPRATGRPPARARRGHASGLAIDRQSLRGVRRLARAACPELLAVAAADVPACGRPATNATHDEQERREA